MEARPPINKGDDFMYAILGAGSAVANEFAKELGRKGERVRLVGRRLKPIGGAAKIPSADAFDLQGKGRLRRNGNKPEFGQVANLPSDFLSRNNFFQPGGRLAAKLVECNAQVGTCIALKPVQAFLELASASREVAVVDMIQPDRNLNQSLEKIPRLAPNPMPQVLECFVAFKEPAGVELLYPFAE
jgi:hypothetical protein